MIGSRWRRPAFRAIAFAMLAISAALAVAPAQAEMTVAQYRFLREGLTQKDQDRIASLVFILTGMLEGAEQASAALAKAGNKPEFCMPRNPKVDGPAFILLIDEELALRPSTWHPKGDDPLALAVMQMLARRFPCK